MLAQFDVLAAQDLVQQGLGDLVAGNILMEQNARAGVRSLPGKAAGPRWSSRAKRTPRRTRSRMIELEERIIRSTVAGLFSYAAASYHQKKVGSLPRHAAYKCRPAQGRSRSRPLSAL